MANLVADLGQFFELFLTCIRDGIDGLNSEYEPNRVDNLLCRLTEFERTFGLLSSRLAEGGNYDQSDQILEDIEQLLDAVRLLQTRYRDRYYSREGATETALFHYDNQLEYTGLACRPRLSVNRDVVQQLRGESLKWVDIARILGISSKTLIRRRREVEMPIGADAFTNIEDSDVDEKVREILQQNPQAGMYRMYFGIIFRMRVNS